MQPKGYTVRIAFDTEAIDGETAAREILFGLRHSGRLDGFDWRLDLVTDENGEHVDLEEKPFHRS